LKKRNKLAVIFKEGFFLKEIFGPLPGVAGKGGFAPRITFNPDFPLENNYVQVLHHGGPDALAHKPQNQARFFLGTDNSK